MKRKLKISIGCAVLMLILVGLLYYVPKSTPIDRRVKAVKLDAQGNEIGTIPIYIEGHKLEYLFQEDRLELEIDSFDNLTDFKVKLCVDSFDDLSDLTYVRINNKSVDLDRMNVDALGMEYLALSFRGRNVSANSQSRYELFFTEEIDCFAFWNDPLNGGESTWYIVSLSNNHTTQEIIEYFHGLVPGY